MGIFSKLFGSKETVNHNLVAEVYMKRQQVNRVIAALLDSGSVSAVTFFTSTKNDIAALCRTEEAKNRIFCFGAEANSIANIRLAGGARIVLAERYPLPKRETEFMEQSGMSQAGLKLSAYCALDDALMLQFGGERIASLMQRMGMSETEAVVHSSINSSIQKAQQKISERVTHERPAPSPEQWFQTNMPQLHL